MKTPFRPYLLAAAAVLAVAAAGAATPPKAGKNLHNLDAYPTTDRVEFVNDCMREHPGPYYETLTKCSCTLETIARTVRYDDFVEMTTATRANSIGGERGGAIRDVAILQDDIKRYREMLSSAKKSCFLVADPARR